MLTIYILRKNNGIHAILRLGKKGGGGVQIHLGALGERAIENNEVFYFLYFYSSQKITKYSRTSIKRPLSKVPNYLSVKCCIRYIYSTATFLLLQV